MTIRIAPDGTFDRARVKAESERLEGLARDLRRLLDGGRPQPTDHPDAPLIEAWDFGLRPAPCLVGVVFGHPAPGVGGAEKLTATSDLYLLDEPRGFARTYSRWYRLGTSRSEYSRIGGDTH